MTFVERFLRWWHGNSEPSLSGMLALGEHDWEKISMGKRRCKSCGAEEWLFWNRYAAIGEPTYEWRDMSLDRKLFGRREKRICEAKAKLVSGFEKLKEAQRRIEKHDKRISDEHQD